MIKNLFSRCIKACDRVILSVPLSIILILVIAAICLLGSIPSFDHIFQSAFFLLCLSALGLMMLYCSARRLPQLFHLYNPQRKVSSSTNNLSEILSLDVAKNSEQKIIDLLNEYLTKKKYKKVVTSFEKTRDTCILFEKAKIGVFGPHLIHLGIAVLLVAGIFTAWAGTFYDLNIKEGESISLEGTDTRLTLEKFSIIPPLFKNMAYEYASRLRVNRVGVPVEWHTLKVNNPVRIDSFKLYQMRYSYDVERIDLSVYGMAAGEQLKIVSANMNRRVLIPELDIGVEIKDFIPDFAIDEKGNVVSRKPTLGNPACYIVAYSPASSNKVVREEWIFRDFAVPHNKSEQRDAWRLGIYKIKMRYITGIKFTRNPAEYITCIGLLFLVMGAILSCYKFYRCLIVKFEDSSVDENIKLRCFAFKGKNMFELDRELKDIKRDMMERVRRL